jgi:hypothetical protein
MSAKVGLPYIHHRERGHFPLTDHKNKKENISAAKGVSKFWTKERTPRGLEDIEHP